MRAVHGEEAGIPSRSPRSLDQRVAIVTGGGQGIGRAIAWRLAQEGASVAVWDLDPAKASAVAEEIQGLGAQAEGLGLDVTRSDLVETAFQDAVTRFGRLDILVNNVGGGGGPPGLVADFEERYWDGSLNSNLKSTFLCSKYFARTLTGQDRPGRIVNIGSINGKSGTPLLGAYSVAKAGVIRLTEVMARELARQRINVNCVCPGVVDTEITQKILQRYPEIFIRAYDLVLPDPGASVRGALERRIPLGRLAAPEDIASAVAFLVSDDAGYITGQAINVCGGMMAN